MVTDKLTWIILPVAIFICIGLVTLSFQVQLNETTKELSNVIKQGNIQGNLTANLQIETLNKLNELKQEYNDTVTPSTIGLISLFDNDSTHGNMTIRPDENLSKSIPDEDAPSGSISGFGGGVVVIQP